MQYRQLNEQDFEKVLLKLKEAAIWLNKNNIDYWQNWNNPTEKHKRWIYDGIINNQFYFVYENNDYIGMFRLQYNDELF